MLTPEQFIAEWPEFSADPIEQVEAAVADAALRTDPAVFGDLVDRAHGYLAAHLLSAAPRGKEARIKGSAFTTLYLAERERLEGLVGSQQVPPQ